ncbi:MAG: SRPBCC family protein [Halobacteria archaeon]|nr:SRPBCC family protein [Halobacteria archaeon]
MIEVSRVVDAPPERVWELLVDTAEWSNWGASVREVEASDRWIKAGSTGRVKTPIGWLKFEIDEFREGEYWSWKVAGVRATGHRVEEVEDGSGTKVTFELPVLAAPYAPVCRHALRRIAELVEKP